MFGRSVSPSIVSEICMHYFGRLTMPAPSADAYGTFVNYVKSGGTWTGSDAQLLTKTAGLFHLMTGSAEFQFV